MQIMIDVSEKDYKSLKKGHVPLNILNVIMSGKPLPRCKNCKWWRDSDGAYRRGVGAESRCPINTVSVANGVGYCYMFKPQESEE